MICESHYCDEISGQGESDEVLDGISDLTKFPKMELLTSDELREKFSTAANYSVTTTLTVTTTTSSLLHILVVEFGLFLMNEIASLKEGQSFC